MTPQESLKKFIRGTTEVIHAADLEAKLKEGRPLIIKAGFDPTAPDIHLGHTVLLRKLRQFQELGHRVVFLIGDFTAQVGDPSGRCELRKKMSMDEIKRNAQTYESQVFKILDKKKTEVLFNSQWLHKLSSQDMLELSAHLTVAQMLARADFRKRFEGGKEISLLEFIYPLLQGYDSVYLKADVELGGQDQKFNLLMGRQLQEAFHQKPQVVMMTPLLEGLDGVAKMSKSLGNTIGISDKPDDMFGKIMSISDALMLRYYEILTDVDLTTIKTMHPKEAKLQLAQMVVDMFYPDNGGLKAKEHFENMFSRHQMPREMAEHKIVAGETLLDILMLEKIVTSKNEARRLLAAGAVSYGTTAIDAVITDEHWSLAKGVLKIGKIRFLRLV